MTPRTTRILLVLAAFAAVAAVAVTEQYLITGGASSMPPPKISTPKPVSLIFVSTFRYYLAWTLLAPGIFWLSRRVPLAQPRWWWSAAFHLALPFAASIPFFTFRLLLNSALAFTAPPLHVIPVVWWKILSSESITIAPTYWALVAAGTVLQFARDDQARQLHAVELRRSLSAAQLDALRMKLQPHFLFNTLNAIGSLAQTGDTDDVVQMVEHLGTLLRLSMDTASRQYVTLDEELRLLNAYLAIEEVRYKDRLVVTRRVDPDTGRALVPNLILQPLAENAVAHGLGGRIEAGRLEVAARRHRGWLELSVVDDGPGLPPGWTLPAGAGHGLGNVRERLAALYGEYGRLVVENAPGGGTVARLRLPLRTEPHAPGGSDTWNG
jgi:signal transduction histidine kinase